MKLKTKLHNRDFLVIVLGFTLVMLTGGCETASTTEKGAGYGALGGAAIGGAVGGWPGAAIGAGAGALGGAAIGAAKEHADVKKEGRTGSSDRIYYYDEDRDQYYYYDEDGYRVYRPR